MERGINISKLDMIMDFQIIGAISNVEIIASGTKIREINRLRKIYGSGRWRKMKGIAKVQFDDSSTYTAEVHWYEAHGIGKKEFKIKRFID